MNNKTLEMINELEEMGYMIIKLTRAMERDMKECEEMDREGKSKECFGCSCNVCLTQI